MKIKILVKPVNLGIADEESFITFQMSEKFNTYEKALKRVAKYLENNYETDLKLIKKESNTWQKYELQGRGGYLIMQIVATIPD